MKISIDTLQARFKATQLFLNHYFKDLNQWNHCYSIKLNFSDEEWNVTIYNNKCIYKTWTGYDIESYIYQHDLENE